MKKFIASFMLLGVLMFSAPQAQAVTIEDLYKEIQGLKEQVGVLKTQIGGQVLGVTTTTTTPVVLYKGVRGGEVLSIQAALKEEGYIIPVVDGVFGPITEAAVKAHQKAEGLPITGIVDNNTRTSILGDSVVSPVKEFLPGCDATTKYSVTTGRACDGSQELTPITPSTGCNLNSAPSITVISPNGGEVYEVGEQIKVKWESCNLPVSTLLEVNISSSNPTVFGFLAPNGTSNDGMETFTVGSLPVGSEYKVVVGVPSYGFNNSVLSKSDHSNNYFSINSETTDPNPPTDTDGDFPAGCTSNSGFSATTGKACSSGSHLISYWWGKVNQHTNPGLNNVNLNKWETDPDGVSGANLDKLTYCKKWFPNTKSVKEFMNQTLVDWKERGNVNNWTSVKMAYQCVQ